MRPMLGETTTLEHWRMVAAAQPLLRTPTLTRDGIALGAGTLLVRGSQRE